MKQQEIQFSSNLRSAIEKRNLSQKQLAIEVGMRKSTLHDYLYGVTPRGLKNAVKLAAILSLSLDDLILGGSYE
jgi:transcriptional regulator with XRE-family HTH domain